MHKVWVWGQGLRLGGGKRQGQEAMASNREGESGADRRANPWSVVCVASRFGSGITCSSTAMELSASRKMAARPH